MAVHNADIAQLFDTLANLLEIEDENPFRIRAYRNAARVVESDAQEMGDLLAAGRDLSELPGIGKDLAGKIRTIVETGTLPLLEEVKSRTPVELSDLTRIAGLGPKRVKELYQELHIDSLAHLEAAVNQGLVHQLPHFGAKTEDRIRAGIQRLKAEQGRMLLAEAEQYAEALRAHLRAVPGVRQVEVAGSYRRRRETVGDLDILVTHRKGADVMGQFTSYGEVAEVISLGETRSSVRLRSGLQVDLRAVPESSYGAALHYFTGSKAHNIAVRKLGVRRGLKINEYGIFKGERRVAGRTEEEVFASVGLPYIEPELREDRGEVEAAARGELPRLVRREDIRGELHAHTHATDGHHSIEEMALAAKARGYEYIAITDHSKRVTVARGLDEKRLAEQMETIDRLNEQLDGIRILKGIELDILEDGALDLPDAILKRLDVTVCSVHSKFELTRDKQTERIMRAMDNPHFNILGHPSGRLLNERPAYQVDMERLVESARERGCFLELNGQPARLDLTDSDCRLAREAGVKVSLSTDAHYADSLDYMRFAIGQARRGWLEPDDVLNTRSWPELRRLLERT